MNHTLATSAQQGLTPNLRQQPPPNVPNAPAMIQGQNGSPYQISQSIPANGMAGYVSAPNNVQHAQSYGGNYAHGQNPSINLPRDAVLFQHQGKP
jgi:hypothetical protein